MDKLPKIITHPLGLTGYALALVFGLIAKLGPSDRWPWLLPVAVAMAGLCIAGGLLSAKAKVGKLGNPALSSVPSTGAVTQTTKATRALPLTTLVEMFPFATVKKIRGKVLRNGRILCIGS